MKAAEINAPRRIEMLQGLAVRQVPYIILPCHDRDYIELEWSMTFFCCRWQGIASMPHRTSSSYKFYTAFNVIKKNQKRRI